MFFGSVSVGKIANTGCISFAENSKKHLNLNGCLIQKDKFFEKKIA